MTHSGFLNLLILLGDVHSRILINHAEQLRQALRLVADNQEPIPGSARDKMIKATKALDEAGLETGMIDVADLARAIKFDLIARHSG